MSDHSAAPTLSIDKIITKKKWKKIENELNHQKQSTDFFICHLTWNTGLRISEITNLKWSDINHDEKYLKIREGKGNKDRCVYFGKKVSTLFKNLKKYHPPKNHHSYLFISKKKSKFSRVQIHRRFKEILRQSKLSSNLSFHSLRHGYATRMLNEGIHLHELKTQLGHNSISTTAIYLHFTEESRRKFDRIC